MLLLDLILSERAVGVNLKSHIQARALVDKPCCVTTVCSCLYVAVGTVLGEPDKAKGNSL